MIVRNTSTSVREVLLPRLMVEKHAPCISAGLSFLSRALRMKGSDVSLTPADVYEAMLEHLEDQELVRLVESRRSEQGIPVSLDDL